MHIYNSQCQCQDCKLRDKTIFCCLNDPDLTIVNSSKNCMTFKKGQILFHEGGNATGIFFLTSGKVKISKLDITGNERIIRLSKEGDILGFRTLLSNEKYPCSATSLEDSTACFIPIEIFYKLMENNFNLSKKILKLLSEELAVADQKLTNNVNKPVKEKIAGALLNILGVYGFEDDNTTINAALKRSDIANIVGATTETVVRNLTLLKDDEIIGYKGKKIRILNYKKLIKVANILG